MAFKKFEPALVGFLTELEQNNRREWFTDNKARYESEVLEPSLRFIAAIADELPGFAPRFTAVAKRQGGSLMRIYRDMRFSKNRQPYKTNVGIQFRHQAGRDVHAPGYYFHIDPHQVFLGVGIWHPDARTLAAIREAIDARQRPWRAARGDKAFLKNFELRGESLQRPPRGYDAGHPLIEDLKRKDFVGVAGLRHADLYQTTIVSRTVKLMQSATPFMRFLCRAVEQPF